MKLSLLVARLLQLVPVLLGTAAVVFAIMHITPGDPVELMMGQAGHVTEEEISQLREHYGLDRPVIVQFGRFLSGATRGDFGISYVHHRPVGQVIMAALPATVELTLFTLLLGLLCAIPLGMIAAIRQGSAWDRTSTVFSLLGISLPGFWLGLVLILVFSVVFKVLPVSGRVSPSVFFSPVTGFYLLDGLLLRRFDVFWDALKHLIMPAIAMGAPLVAVTARMTRSSMLEVLRQDYVLFARAKGLPNAVVYAKHALKNALVPTVTVVAIQVGLLLGGNMIIKAVFGWPGVGRLAVDAVQARNYPLIQAVVLLYAVTYVFLNLLADIVCLHLDPRSAA